MNDFFFFFLTIQFSYESGPSIFLSPFLRGHYTICNFFGYTFVVYNEKSKNVGFFLPSIVHLSEVQP